MLRSDWRSDKFIVISHMHTSSDINLLKAKTLLTPEMVVIEQQLRKTSLILLTILVLTGIFFGTGYLILRQKYASLSYERQAAMTAISGEIRKEGLLMSIKDRLASAKKIVDVYESWPVVFDLTARIAGSKKTSFAINDKREIGLTIKTDTLEEAFIVVDQILTEESSKLLANPILNGIQYLKDGTIQLSVTFIATPTL